LKDMSQETLLLYIDALIGARCLAMSKGQYPTVSVTELGTRVMLEQESVWLSLP
jgi:hypothetical protein